MKEPVVDRGACQGHRVCVGIAPKVFEIGDDGKSAVKDPEGASEFMIQRAIYGCPAGAISWKKSKLKFFSKVGIVPRQREK